IAGYAVAGREDRTRQARDAHRHARRHAVRDVRARRIRRKPGGALMASRMSPRKPSSAGAVRSVTYSTSPLLASKTPPWRSKFLVALVGASFCVLLGRALYVQVIGTAFFQKQ